MKTVSEGIEVGAETMHKLPHQDDYPESASLTPTRFRRRKERTPSFSTHLCQIALFGLLSALLALSLTGCTVESTTSAPATPHLLPATWTLTPRPTVNATTTEALIKPTTTQIEPTTYISLEATETSLPEVYAPIEKLDHFTTLEDLQPTMIDAEHGWAVGGTLLDPRHILITEDGGWTWREVTPPAMAPSGRFKSRAGAYFLDESHAWVVYQDRYLSGHKPAPVLVWRTQDGGKSWTPSQPLNLQGLDGFIVGQNKMIFTDPYNGWIFASVPIPPYGGDGQTHIFHTTDGGNVWRRLSIDPVGDGRLLNSIHEEKFMLSSGGVGFAQVPDGLPPYILWTQDGGRRWSKIALPTPDWAPDFFDVARDSIGCLTEDSAMLPNGAAFILVSCSKPEGPTLALYRSLDGAQTWEALAVPEDDGWRILIDFLDNENGWIAGSSISRTHDGGRTWQTIKHVGWDYIQSIQFVDEQNGWAFVMQEIRRAEEEWAFVRTDDGGRTWTQLVPRVIADSN